MVPPPTSINKKKLSKGSRVSSRTWERNVSVFLRFKQKIDHSEQLSKSTETVNPGYLCFWRNASQFDRRLFPWKVVSIYKSRFDRRQESVRSKTVTDSLNLLTNINMYRTARLFIWPFFMFRAHLFSYFGVQNCFVWKTFATMRSYDNMFQSAHWALPIRNAEKETPTIKEINWKLHSASGI